MKKNKKDNLVKIFLTVFLFVFLFVNFNQIAYAADNVSDDPSLGLGSGNTNISTELQQKGVKPLDGIACPWVTSPLICTAKSILPVMSGLVSLAVTLFSWAINPAKMSAVIGDSNGSIYLAWKNVRDLLNIAFILFLLFSAFCTVFQVSKYSYKSILLNLVLMALLVNFSFPIARFIIDVSNVLMYTMLSELFPGGTGDLIALKFADMSQIANIVNPKTAGLVQLIMANIFLFILAITFLVMALLFVIRIIALAILIIFSPLAFTGSLIPGLQDKASSWWKHLFNYSFFGPIMIFMIYIAFSLANATSIEMSQTAASVAAKNSTDPSWIVNLCQFVIPIIILWMGMGIAKSMSIAGAGTITDYAQGKLKGMGKWTAGLPWRGIKKAGEASGITGGVKQAWKQKVTQPLERAKEGREAIVAGALGDKGAKERNLKARAAQYEKDGETDADLEKMAKNGNAAAALAMANKGTTTLAAYTGVMAKLDPIKDKNIIDLLDRKTREKKIDIIVDYKINKLGTGATAAQKTNAAVDELNKLDPDKWRDQDIESLLSTSANATTNTAAAQKVFSDFNPQNKKKVTENMKGGKYTAGKGTVWP